MRNLSFLLGAALLISSCGGTVPTDHAKIANQYKGSWTSDTIPVGGFVVIEFAQNGQITGDFNDPIGGLAFSVVPAESWFNGNHVQIMMANADGGNTFLLVGDLFLNGTTLTGNLVRHDNHAHYSLSVGVPPP